MFCTQCGVKADSNSNYCSNCGEPLSKSSTSKLTDSESISTELNLSRRQMTVLFCDLVDSTHLAETMDAEDLFYAMQAYHAMVKRIALRYNGHVAKIVGDGVDLYFGYPLAGEDDAVRAVHVALAIIEEIKQLTDSDGKPFNLQVRVGLATGRVAVGMLDTMAISGSTPHLAARIQAAAQPGQVVVAPGTRSVAGEQFAYLDLGMFSLKGFTNEVRISAVTGAYACESRSAWRGHDSKLSMVGRDAEMALLQKGWRNTSTDHTTGILLQADAGMGKSRLSTAFAESLQDEMPLTIRLQCSPFHNNSVLHPIMQHLTVSAGF
ncbi:MAG TPA: zinc-ribbon domain-containing protein [Gammaproteobacteria bacterium]|nr:zinc-ribbon domain-containing protein [Gammaproteobacteria bacterium]